MNRLSQNFSKVFKLQHGFSLLEMLAVVVILGILGMVATGIVAMGSRSARQITDRGMGRTEIRNVLGILRSDIQKIAPDSLVLAQTNQLFFHDIDGNYIQYIYSGNELSRSGQVILSDLQSAPFSYFNSSVSVVTSNISTIRYIRVNLNLIKNGNQLNITDTFYVRN